MVTFFIKWNIQFVIPNKLYSPSLHHHLHRAWARASLALIWYQSQSDLVSSALIIIPFDLGDEFCFQSEDFRFNRSSLCSDRRLSFFVLSPSLTLDLRFLCRNLLFLTSESWSLMNHLWFRRRLLRSRRRSPILMRIRYIFIMRIMLVFLSSLRNLAVLAISIAGVDRC